MKNICTTALLACGIALATSASPVAAQTRNAALFAAAEKAQPAVIETLRELVLIESGSGNVPGLLASRTMPKRGSNLWAQRPSASSSLTVIA